MVAARGQIGRRISLERRCRVRGSEGGADDGAGENGDAADGVEEAVDATGFRRGKPIVKNQPSHVEKEQPTKAQQKRQHGQTRRVVDHEEQAWKRGWSIAIMLLNFSTSCFV